MITIKSLLDDILDIKDDTLSTELKRIVEKKQNEYNLAFEQEIANEFIYDIVNSYTIFYFTKNKKDNENREKLLNKITSFVNIDPYFLNLDKESFKSLYFDEDSKAPFLDFNNQGVSFAQIIKKSSYILEKEKDNNYNRTRLKEVNRFLKYYLLNIIVDNDTIFRQDLVECMKMFVDLSLPNDFDNQIVNSVKQKAGAFNMLVGSNVQFHEIGLSYEQLKTRYPKKDGWVRNKEDERRLTQLREITHYYFDQLWNESNPDIHKKMSRQQAYAWLAQTLRLPSKDTHIAVFDEKRCIKTILEVFHILGR